MQRPTRTQFLLSKNSRNEPLRGSKKHQAAPVGPLFEMHVCVPACFAASALACSSAQPTEQHFPSTYTAPTSRYTARTPNLTRHMAHIHHAHSNAETGCTPQDTNFRKTTIACTQGTTHAHQACQTTPVSHGVAASACECVLLAPIQHKYTPHKWACVLLSTAQHDTKQHSATQHTAGLSPHSPYQASPLQAHAPAQLSRAT
jgi:hypothetical protein